MQFFVMIRPLRSRHCFSLNCRKFSGKSTPHAVPDFGHERQSRHFNHKEMEKDLYQWWECQGFFQPVGRGKRKNEPFVIIMPPPNITGRLHMGHAVYASIQDVLCRYNRMLGRPTLWLPGADHAGIATQHLVLSELNNKGLSVDDISRDEFLENAWKNKEEKGDIIFHQLRCLGASADWSRCKFTLDSDMQDSVVEAIVRLHERGLIYRGKYMVNWSPSLRTAVSDLEVDFAEEEGSLYHFKYRVVDEQGVHTGLFLPVSTTRPETIPGDCALCVHPTDDRYLSLVGKYAEVPISKRVIPILADDYVDKEFGTGALKVTPAHDSNDYEIGLRHNLTAITILNEDGTMNSKAGKYEGLDRYECRQMIWEDMRGEGLTIKVDKHIQRVPRSQRSGEIIEPMLSKQWFLKTSGMASKAIDAVEKQNVKILPEKFEKLWFHWLGDNRDWCISRQLWWGHRIPIYYVDGDESKWVVARSEEDALVQARKVFGGAAFVTQDEDVLDTWFSSGLWPFIALGWPPNMIDDTVSSSDADFNKYYPTSVLETGYDILFFWVARMVMLGLELTGEVPFNTVYLHGLVRDKDNEKMSKTKGNVVDPLEVIDSCGCDAMRYTLLSGLSPGQDIAFDARRVSKGKNFVNKVWNLGKYIASKDDPCFGQHLDTSDSCVFDKRLAIPERYILSRCEQVTIKVSQSLHNYYFADAIATLHDFVWNEFADWYVEISKNRCGTEDVTSRNVLHSVWDRTLHLLHPFMPFLTETLWLRRKDSCRSLMMSQWPDSCASNIDEEAIIGFETLQLLVKSIRAVKTEYKVDSKSSLLASVIFSENGLLHHKLEFSDFEREKSSIALLSRVSFYRIVRMMKVG